MSVIGFMQKKTDTLGRPFFKSGCAGNCQRSICNHFSLSSWSGRIETPADFVALGCGTKLALATLGGRFECAAAAHFFEDTLAIEFGLQSLECPVNGLSFFHSHSTHAFDFLV